MKKLLPLFGLLFCISFFTRSQVLVYHTIQTDANHKLIPWYNATPGISYNHCLHLIWDFWKTIPSVNGNKYYMTDHSWNPGGAANKVGGDQFAMLLSSWALSYAYTGDTALVSDMEYIADTYLAHSLSGATDAWPNIPYPCNYTNTGSAIYDGDYLLGAGFTQPDKAGSFGAELVTLYKITGDTNYLHEAVNIANVLAAKVRPGDASHSPYDFRLKASDGSLPPLLPTEWSYTGNVVPTLRLFESLSKMNTGNVVQYDTAYNMIKRWVQQYPEQNNNWGSFFEDIPVPSNTEINAVSMAWYILEHPNWSATYQHDARSIMDWTLSSLGSHAYDTIGVTAIYEQSADLKEGGSHTSRFASVELIYAMLTGDTTHVDQALRQLNWATYLVDTSGLCRFSPAEGSVWYTDGYGDFVRHFLRAMAAYPEIAPPGENHVLGSTSVITNITYLPQEIHYYTYDDSAVEVLRLAAMPLNVKFSGVSVAMLTGLTADGWTWTPLSSGGVLKVRHDNSGDVDILLQPSSGVNDIESSNSDFKLYPNPATDRVQLSFSKVPGTQARVEIHNTTGQLMQSNSFSIQPFQQNLLNLDIEHLIPGTYIVTVTTPNSGIRLKQLFVVNR